MTLVVSLTLYLRYTSLQETLLSSIKLHDTCGVHNLHGMPGVLGGLVSAVMAACASTSMYGTNLHDVYPGMVSRSASAQGAIQVHMRLVTVICVLLWCLLDEVA